MANYIVFAASSSIGQTVVRELRDLGHNVLTTSRNAQTITPDFELDITDFEGVERVFQAAIESYSNIDGVINCAGSLLLKPAHMTSKEQFMATIDSSLTSSFAVVRAAGKYMTSGGSVVLLSSAAAKIGLANHEAIAAAKAGIIGLALSASATYASQNIRFNVIAPGLVETKMTQSITNNPDSRKFSENMHALGRIGHVQDIANAAIFLLNPQNSWITGQVLAVDGGLSSLQPKIKKTV
jgi:NAD(P)-dependent dehydrogenase (short-subunit alcohol dehydrogenase family)